MDVKNKTFNSLVNYYNKDKNIKKFLALTKAMVTSPKSTPLMRGEICESVLYVILTDFIERNNLKNPVYVGDTEGDAESAKAAGIPFVFAKYGFGNVKEYQYAINKFEDLSTLKW